LDRGVDDVMVGAVGWIDFAAIIFMQDRAEA
jgi:hypothetical protein